MSLTIDPTIKADANDPGICVENATPGQVITLLDTSPSNPPGGRVWACVVFPSNRTTAPSVTNSTANPASFTVPQEGGYAIRLRRMANISTVQSEHFIYIGCPDTDGNIIPPAGLDANLINTTEAINALGWAGGESVSAVPMLEGAVRTTRDRSISSVEDALLIKESIGITPEQFGAVGDGSTDDVTAINNALASMSAGGTLKLGRKTYAIGSTIVIPHDGIAIEGVPEISKFRALASNAATNLITATGRSNVHLYGLTVDVNQAARSGSPLNGILYSSCEDSDVTWCTVKNAKGPSGFAIALAGAAVRCIAHGCRVMNAGPSPTSNVADGIYTSGEQNLISACIAEDCFDHGFVIEASNYSGIAGCTALRCGAGGGISATSADCIGNYIDGLTVGQWYATVTGGVDILVTGAGNLYNTRITGLTMSEHQTGATVALYLRRTGGGDIDGVEISSFLIDGADTYGIALSDGCKNVRIGQGRVNANTGVLLGDSAVGCDFVFFSDMIIKTEGTFGIYTRTGSDTVQLRDVHIIGKAGTTTTGAHFETACTNILDVGTTGTDCSTAVIVGAGSTSVVKLWVDLTDAQTVGGAKTWSNAARFSSTVRIDDVVSVNQASGNAMVAITANTNNFLGTLLVPNGGTSRTGYGFGASGEYGGLDHDVPTAAGVIRLGASVRLDIGITSGNYSAPWTFTAGAFVRSNGTIISTGINKDPSSDRARLCILAGTSGDSPLNIAEGTAKSSPSNGDIDNTSTNLLLTKGGTRYQVPLAYGTGVTSINITATALTVGQVATNTGTVTGARAGDLCMVTPASAPDNGTVWDAYVSANDTVTVRVTCVTASITTTSTNYNVMVVHKP